MVKRGQISHTLLYIAAGIITAIIVYYGATQILGVKERGKEAEFIMLKNTISLDVQRISSQPGAARNFSYLLPPEFNQICFVDTSKADEISQNPEIHPAINDSVQSGSENNVFFLGQTVEAFNAGKLQVCKSPVKCFETTAGRARVEMYGGGGFGLLDPCEVIENLPPVITNITPLLVNVEVPTITDTTTIVSRAQVEDDHDLSVSFKWSLNDTPENIELSSGIITSGETTEQSITKPPGRYRLIIVATDSAGKSSSKTFNIIIGLPDNKPPLAFITKPTVFDNYNPGQVITFQGSGSDDSTGTLNYEWDFGDGVVKTGTYSETRASGQEVVLSQTTHSYNSDGSYQVTFTVTDEGGLSDTAFVTINVGNTLPWMTDFLPVQNAIVPSEVTFEFIPHDNEQNTVNCLLIIDGRRVSLGQFSVGTSVEHTETLQQGPHNWVAACSDGFGTNTSETMRFTVLEIPVLSCSLTTSCNALSVTLASLSSETNAHISKGDDPNYPWKVCCSLAINGNLLDTLTATCGETAFKIYSQTNSHAETKTSLFYTENICLETQEQGFGINCRSDGTFVSPGMCDENETCLLSLSSETNAHVAKCDYYPIKVCCKVET